MKERREEIFNANLPLMKSGGGLFKVWNAVLIAIILWGLYALWIQLTQGHIVTGMRDHVVWGIYIVNFIFFIGLGYSGSVIAALLFFGNIKWRTPIVRVATVMMVIATIIGPIYILMEIGRLDRIHHLFIYARLQSPIMWDVIAVMTYLIGCIMFFYLRVIRDFSFMSKKEVFSETRRKLYKWLSINYNEMPEQDRLLKQSNYILGALIIPIAILVSSILSWIFGMTLRPGWHSSIFGPYFVLAAVYSGIGVVTIILYIYRSVYNLQDYITEKHFTYLGYALIVFGAGYGYFTFSEYFTDWYTSKEWNARLIEMLFDPEKYGWATFFTTVGGILLPLIVIGFPQLRSVKSIAAVSVVMVVAMWAKRYLIIIPTLENTLIPMQEIRPEVASYSATWVEWALIAASFAGFAFLFTWITRFVGILPIYTSVELQEESEPYGELKPSQS